MSQRIYTTAIPSSIFILYIIQNTLSVAFQILKKEKHILLVLIYKCNCMHCSSLPNSESVKLIRTSRISQPSWIGYSTTQGPVHQSPSGNPGYPGDTLAPKEGEDH